MGLEAIDKHCWLGQYSKIEHISPCNVVLKMDQIKYTANLQFIERYFPAVYKSIQNNPPPSPTMPLEIVPGKKGVDTLRVKVEDSWKYLHSQYDPVNEAKRWAESQVPPHGSVAVLIGWAFGYHVIEWIKQYGKDIEAVVVVEPEPALFHESLSRIDLRSLTNTPRLEFVLGTTGEEFYQALLKFMEFVLSADLLVIPLPFVDIYPNSFFEVIRSEIQKLMSTKKQMLTHMAEQGYRCQENIICNLPHMIRCLLPHDIHKSIPNQPAIIVAAGPSLDKNINTLHRAQNHAWIFAVDTSLRILQQHGIEAQFVVTKDPTENNRLHFEGMNNIESPMLAFDPQVLPDIPQRFSGPKICLPNRNHAIHHHLRGLELTAADETPLSTNVAVAAFNLAVLMGCNPIIFAGLDLCFSNLEGRSHAAGSALSATTRFSGNTKEMLYCRGSALDTIQVMEVEGIDGKRYPTHPTFYEALRLLESLIQKSQVQCINATEGGAKIEGTQIMPLADALNNYAWQLIEYSVLTQKKGRIRNGKNIQESILEIAHHLLECEQIADRALSNLPDLAEISRQQIEKDYRLYHELQSALERVMVEISRPGFFDINDKNELTKRYEWYFSEIKKACEYFRPIYEEIAQLPDLWLE